MRLLLIRTAIMWPVPPSSLAAGELKAAAAKVLKS